MVDLVTASEPLSIVPYACEIPLLCLLAVGNANSSNSSLDASISSPPATSYNLEFILSILLSPAPGIEAASPIHYNIGMNFSFLFSLLPGSV